MPTVCLFKSGTKDTSTHECTAGRALWGSKHTWWSSMRALWSSRSQFITLWKNTKNKRTTETYYSERDITGSWLYTGHTPYWSVYLNAVLGPLAVVKKKRKIARFEVTSAVYVFNQECTLDNAFKTMLVHSMSWPYFHCFGSADVDKLNYQISCRCCKSYETTQCLSVEIKHCLHQLKEWHHVLQKMCIMCYFFF